MTVEQRSERNRKGANTRVANGDWEPIKRKGDLAAWLAYRKDELPVLADMERVFSAKFQKEGVDGVYFDFANEDYLIEHTRDDTKGICDATRRFAVAAARGDQRKRIAYLDTSKLGPLRRGRLEALNVEIRDVTSLPL